VLLKGCTPAGARSERGRALREAASAPALGVLHRPAGALGRVQALAASAQVLCAVVSGSMQGCCGHGVAAASGRPRFCCASIWGAARAWSASAPGMQDRPCWRCMAAIERPGLLMPPLTLTLLLAPELVRCRWGAPRGGPHERSPFRCTVG